MSEQTPRYCLKCFYALRDLDSHVCPECGRGFDPDDPRTTSARPIRSIPRSIALFATILTFVLAGVTLLMFLLSALAFDTILLFLFGLALAPFVLILLALVALPMLRIDWRVRVLAVACTGLVLSIVILGWPFQLVFKLHQSALEERAALIRSGELAVPTGPVTVGILPLKTIRELNGNIGFQLTGGFHGGEFVVHLAPDATSVWHNTNWEVTLDDDWVWVYED
jgi:hypothetical protein